MSKSCSKKINKTRYDDPGKPMKQTSFTVKNLGRNLLEKQSTIVKRSFKSSTKPLSLDSIIPIDELTAKTFYRFKTSELLNIWMPPFLHKSQYVTNSPTWKRCWLQSSSLQQQWRSRSTWFQTLRRKDAVGSFRENKASVTFCMCSPCILLFDSL